MTKRNPRNLSRGPGHPSSSPSLSPFNYNEGRRPPPLTLEEHQDQRQHPAKRAALSSPGSSRRPLTRLKTATQLTVSIPDDDSEHPPSANPAPPFLGIHHTAPASQHVHITSSGEPEDFHFTDAHNEAFLISIDTNEGLALGLPPSHPTSALLGPSASAPPPAVAVARPTPLRLFSAGGLTDGPPDAFGLSSLGTLFGGTPSLGLNSAGAGFGLGYSLPTGTGADGPHSRRPSLLDGANASGQGYLGGSPFNTQELLGILEAQGIGGGGGGGGGGMSQQCQFPLGVGPPGLSLGTPSFFGLLPSPGALLAMSTPGGSPTLTGSGRQRSAFRSIFRDHPPATENEGGSPGPSPPPLVGPAPAVAMGAVASLPPSQEHPEAMEEEAGREGKTRTRIRPPPSKKPAKAAQPQGGQEAGRPHTQSIRELQEGGAVPVPSATPVALAPALPPSAVAPGPQVRPDSANASPILAGPLTIQALPPLLNSNANANVPAERAHFPPEPLQHAAACAGMGGPRGMAMQGQVCYCKRTSCVRLYCVCFSQGRYCSAKCHCTAAECLNLPGNEERLAKAKAKVRRKHSTHFTRAVGEEGAVAGGAGGAGDSRTDGSAGGGTLAAAAGGGVSSSAAPAGPLAYSSQPLRVQNAKGEAAAFVRVIGGCICKRSRCLKAYCQCKQAGVPCTAKCSCVDCENGKPGTGTVTGATAEGGARGGESEKEVAGSAGQGRQGPGDGTATTGGDAKGTSDTSGRGSGQPSGARSKGSRGKGAAAKRRTKSDSEEGGGSGAGY